MADAKIVNIKGVQWDLKDEVARNKIAELEKSLIAQDLEDINITMNEGYTSTLAVMRSHYKIGKIHFAIMQIDNISGQHIGTSATANIGRINLKAQKTTSCILLDYYNKASLRASVANDGSVTIDESVGVVQGSNVCLGEVIFVEQ